MQGELFSVSSPGFASTREDALRQLEAFVPFAGRYAGARNHVVAGHTNVSRLSPAIRHRLILESECAAAPLRRYAASTVEKFTQEVYWRRYWKSWLSLRPQVWTRYLEDLRTLVNDPRSQEVLARAARCEAGKGPVSIMNHFAEELRSTGYLHNHARMWFAAWWIHVERLPWQLGADFFLRHLLDGDPASNTLSWRWVAGLHTPGKTYLPRRSNLEKHLPLAVLSAHREGLALLESPQALALPEEPRPAVTRPSLPQAQAPDPGEGPIGIWIHEEDLFVEQGPLDPLRPDAILVCGDSASWDGFRHAAPKTSWLREALADASRRAASAFGVEARLETASPVLEAVPRWAAAHRLRHIVAMRPEVGPLSDQLDALRDALGLAGTRLHLHDRPEDLLLRPFATGGFFRFWEEARKAGVGGFVARSAGQG